MVESGTKNESCAACERAVERHVAEKVFCLSFKPTQIPGPQTILAGYFDESEAKSNELASIQREETNGPSNFVLQVLRLFRICINEQFPMLGRPSDMSLVSRNIEQLPSMSEAIR